MSATFPFNRTITLARADFLVKTIQNHNEGWIISYAGHFGMSRQDMRDFIERNRDMISKPRAA